MKYDLLVFTKAPEDYGPKRINEEIQKLGLTGRIMSYPRLTFEINRKKVTILHEGQLLPEARAVVFRAAGGDGYYIPQRDYLLDWYMKKEAKVLNFKTYKKWSRLDKITQHLEFQRAGLPFVDTLNFGADRRLLAWAETAEYPFIAKHDLSSQGRDVYKINRYHDLKKMLKNYCARTVLIQSFLPYGFDLRLICIGGQVVGAMKRIAQKGQFLTNYSRGGSVVAYDLGHDKAAVEIAQKTAKYFDLDYVGVDLMADKEGNWRILEINRACQFEGFEKATQLNVGKKIVTFFNL